MNISASYYSSIGGRDNNEDAVLLCESSQNVVGLVTDGLGGHINGEIASKIAVKTINLDIMHKEVSKQGLKSAIEHANNVIYEKSQINGMKTTVAAIWFDDENAIAANVGDTRIYQFRGRNIVYQSRDHSVAELSYLAGDLRYEQIRTSRERHTLTRALGGQEEVKIDIVPLMLQKGDALLLCSDGFWEKIKEEEMIEELLGMKDAGTWINRMKERIKETDNLDTGDNHSAIAVIVL